MALKGLRGFRFVPLTKDNKTDLEYEEIQKIIGAINTKIKPKVNSAELYGDDQLLETASSLGGIDVDIDVTELPLEQRAIILGNKFENGVLIENKGDTPPDIAFGFIAAKSGGGDRMVWLTKGKAEPIEEEGKTQGDKIDFQTQKLKFKFMPRIYDGHHKFTADTNLEGAPTEEEFFSIDFLKTGKKPVKVGA
ncbi:MAG: phage tail protein [Clostridium sp.]|uniref:major tail protein n=1 Tax=Clostridium TaxID=1485 RepID=UPI001F43A5E1|nr:MULTISPECIES: major tail protein [Clostridium]MDU7250840.1 phage tail protein [Clostridium sp.]UJA30859.1 phage tail protein [Clostridium sporogenes]